MHRARINKVTYSRSPDLDGLEAGTFEGFVGTRAYYPRREVVYGFAEGNGTREFHYRGEQHRVNAQDLVVIQPGEPYSAEVPKPLDIKWLHIDVTLFRHVAGITDPRVDRLPHLVTLAPSDAVLLRSVARLHKAVMDRAPLAERERLLEEVVTRTVSKHTGPRPVKRRAPRKVAMMKAREHMQESLDRNVPLKELADMVDLSVFQFVRAFAKEIGLTPHALLIHMRVQKARELLRRGRSATEASQEAGFADPSHLVRHFKRVFKVTPGAYAAAVAREEDDENFRREA